MVGSEKEVIFIALIIIVIRNLRFGSRQCKIGGGAACLAGDEVLTATAARPLGCVARGGADR